MPNRKNPFREHARHLGLKWYNTGKDCANGHRCERRTSDGSCMECKKASDQRRYPSRPVRPCKICERPLLNAHQNQRYCKPCRLAQRRAQENLRYHNHKNDPEFSAGRKGSYLRARANPDVWARRLEQSRQNNARYRQEPGWREHAKQRARERYQRDKSDPSKMLKKRIKERNLAAKNDARRERDRARYLAREIAFKTLEHLLNGDQK